MHCDATPATILAELFDQHDGLTFIEFRDRLMELNFISLCITYDLFNDEDYYPCVVKGKTPSDFTLSVKGFDQHWVGCYTNIGGFPNHFRKGTPDELSKLNANPDIPLKVDSMRISRITQSMNTRMFEVKYKNKKRMYHHTDANSIAGYLSTDISRIGLDLDDLINGGSPFTFGDYTIRVVELESK